MKRKILCILLGALILLAGIVLAFTALLRTPAEPEEVPLSAAETATPTASPLPSSLPEVIALPEESAPPTAESTPVPATEAPTAPAVSPTPAPTADPSTPTPTFHPGDYGENITEPVYL